MHAGARNAGARRCTQVRGTQVHANSNGAFTQGYASKGSTRPAGTRVDTRFRKRCTPVGAHVHQSPTTTRAHIHVRPSNQIRASRLSRCRRQHTHTHGARTFEMDPKQPQQQQNQPVMQAEAQEARQGSANHKRRRRGRRGAGRGARGGGGGGGGGRREGQCLSWHAENGWGFVRDDLTGAAYFCHHTSIHPQLLPKLGQDAWKPVMYTGEHVSFRLAPNPRDPSKLMCVDVTGSHGKTMLMDHVVLQVLAYRTSQPPPPPPSPPPLHRETTGAECAASGCAASGCDGDSCAQVEWYPQGCGGSYCCAQCTGGTGGTGGTQMGSAESGADGVDEDAADAAVAGAEDTADW